MKLRFTIFCTVWMFLAPSLHGQAHPPLKFLQSIAMPNVEGYFDHPAVDVKGQRLFVPGEYQETVEVIDLRAGKAIHSITALGGHPRKIVYIPQSNQIWVDLGSGQCKAFSGDSYQLLTTVQLNPDSPPEAKREPDNGVSIPPHSSSILVIAAT